MSNEQQQSNEPNLTFAEQNQQKFSHIQPIEPICELRLLYEFLVFQKSIILIY